MLKNTVSSSVQKARILFETRKYDAVLTELAFYLENHQEDSDARFLLAESLWRVGRKSEALRQFDKCFNGDKCRRDIAVHVCSLLYHEISIGSFYWSDLIYWCSSAMYCGVSETFVKGLVAKFCGNQVHIINDDLFESHCKWISDVKTLTEDVKHLRLSLKRINMTPKRTKSDNIHGVHSDQEDHVDVLYYQENSQIDRFYFNGFNNYNSNHQCNSYFNTNILQPYSNNNNFNVNNSWHTVYDSETYNIPKCTIVTLLHTHTKVKSTRNTVLGSKPVKTYQKQRRRKVYSRKLRKDLLMILKYFRNTNLILLKCISYTHTRVLHYMSYLLGVKYLNYSSNSTIRCIIVRNNNTEHNTNNFYLNTTDSFDMRRSTQSNVRKAIRNFCPDNEVILERLRKKSKFDTNVETFNAIAKFCNNSKDILKRLQSRSTSNECHFSSPLEEPNNNKEDTPHFARFISDDSYSTKKLQVFSKNSLETNKHTLKMPVCSFDAQHFSKSQINITLSNEIVPNQIKEANKHELNILGYKSHCDHEIITKVVNEIYTHDYITENVCNYTDGHVNNVIQHNNNIEIINMISCRDLEYKPTSYQLRYNKTHINCVKQKNLEVGGVSKKYYIRKKTSSHDANKKVSDTSIYLSTNNLKLNNCFVNISKHFQTAFTNTMNDTQYNDSSNTIRNSVGEKIWGFLNITNNNPFYESITSDKVADTIVPYNGRVNIIDIKEYSETQKCTIGSEVDENTNNSNYTLHLNACFKMNETNFADHSNNQSSTLSNALNNSNSTNFQTQHFIVMDESEKIILASDNGSDAQDSVQKSETQNNTVCREDISSQINSCPRTLNSEKSPELQKSTVNNLIHDTIISYNNTKLSDESSNLTISAEYLVGKIMQVSNGDICSNTNNSETYKSTLSCDNVEASIFYYSKSTTSKDFFEIEKYKGGNEVYNYCSKSKRKTKYSEEHSGIGYNSSKLGDLYKDNVCPNLSKLPNDGYVKTQCSNKYTDEVDYSNISSVKVFLEKQNYAGHKAVKDYAPFFEEIFKIQQGTICNKVDNTILSYNSRSDNIEVDFKTNTNMDCVTDHKSVQCLTTLNLNDYVQAPNSTVYNEVGTIIACNSPSNTSVNNFKTLIMQVFEAVDKNVLKQLGLNLSLLRKCESQNLGLITELDNTHVKYSKILDDIQNSISLCENIEYNYDSSNDYYVFKNKQRLEKINLNTHNTQRKVPRLLENVYQRFFTPKYNSFEKSNLNIFYDTQSCHLVKLCPFSSEHTSDLSCLQFFQDRSKNSRMSEICRSIATSDGGYDSGVSVGNKTTPNTQNLSFFMQNADRKYYSGSTNRKYFNSKVWSTHFNSIVKKYLYIPYYVDPKVDLSIYLGNINIDRSRTSLNSFNGVLKIYNLSNNGRKCNPYICQDRCKCQIDHLIHDSFLHAAVPNLSAISLFCDPSKLLVRNLCGDLFAKPVFNGVLRVSYCMPKSNTKVKDSTFLLVNLCTNICVPFNLS